MDKGGREDSPPSTECTDKLFGSHQINNSVRLGELEELDLKGEESDKMRGGEEKETIHLVLKKGKTKPKH